MWIVPWDPFLMKMLLKSGICGLVSSAWVHCSRLTSSNSAVGTKKKKSENTNTATYNSNPNTYIVPVWFSVFRWILGCIFWFFFSQPHYLTKSTVNCVLVHCSRTHKFHFSTTFSLKMGPTVLFTHLKIILL